MTGNACKHGGTAMIKQCAHCGRFFKTYNPDKIYCSQDCRKRARKIRDKQHRQAKEAERRA